MAAPGRGAGPPAHRAGAGRAPRGGRRRRGGVGRAMRRRTAPLCGRCAPAHVGAMPAPGCGRGQLTVGRCVAVSPRARRAPQARAAHRALARALRPSSRGRDARTGARTWAADGREPRHTPRPDSRGREARAGARPRAADARQPRHTRCAPAHAPRPDSRGREARAGARPRAAHDGREARGGVATGLPSVCRSRWWVSARCAHRSAAGPGRARSSRRRGRRAARCPRRSAARSSHRWTCPR